MPYLSQIEIFALYVLFIWESLNKRSYENGESPWSGVFHWLTREYTDPTNVLSFAF